MSCATQRDLSVEAFDERLEAAGHSAAETVDRPPETGVRDFFCSEMQVPFRILTKDEQKEFSKTWEDIKKAWEKETGQ